MTIGDVRHQTVVIVGAGHAGGRAAEALRQHGFPGRVTVVGEECWPPYERPPLSKDFLAGAVDVDRLLVRPMAWYAEQNIELILNTRVEAIDRKERRLRLSDKRRIPYDRLLLATGATPRALPVDGAHLPGVHYVRGIADSLKLRERLRPGARVLVIGAGFIGLEVAAVARERDCDVMIAERGAYPLGRVASAEIGRFFADLHLGRGVDLRINTAVTGIAAAKKGLTAFMADGVQWHGDVIVVGIGAVPSISLAAAAGLKVDNGIVTDEFGRSNDAAIYAAGDVTSHFHPLLGRHVRLETWQNAQNQAIAVAKVIAGGEEPYCDVPWFWTDQYGVNFQSAGAPLAWDEVIWRGDLEKQRCTAFYLQDSVVVGGATVNNGRDMRFIKQLIAHKATVDPALLADPTIKMDQILCNSTG